MSADANAIHFFLGANTSDGFVFRPDELGKADENWHKFLIKGGPGTGKSTLCKQIAKMASAYTDHIEFLHCSSDPHSLDGIILNDYKISFFPQKQHIIPVHTLILHIIRYHSLTHGKK